MKKIICIFVSLIIMGTASFAQKKAVKPKQDTKTAPAPTGNETKKATTAAEPKQTKTKKDGTPDMRYKENKEAAKPAVKLKKDGTPDMRYKANKDAAKKK
jgi:hypothetical protein